MANVLIVAYLLIVLALIVVILLQRSEGGALGIGGGGNSGGGLMTARGSANLLTRTTAILATLFFATAIGLTILSELDRSTSSILDRAVTTPEGEAPSNVLDALNALQGDMTSDLPVPDAGTTTAPATAPQSSTSDLPVPTAPAVTEETPASEPAASAPQETTETPAPSTGN